MQICRQSIDELESSIRNSLSSHRLTPQVISNIIRAQHDSFISLASKVAAVHDTVERYRERYDEYAQKYLGRQNNTSISGDRMVELSTIAANTLVPTACQSQGQIANSQAPLMTKLSHGLNQPPGYSTPAKPTLIFTPTSKRSNSMGAPLTKFKFQ